MLGIFLLSCAEKQKTTPKVARVIPSRSKNAKKSLDNVAIYDIIIS